MGLSYLVVFSEHSILHRKLGLLDFFFFLCLFPYLPPLNFICHVIDQLVSFVISFCSSPQLVLNLSILIHLVLLEKNCPFPVPK